MKLYKTEAAILLLAGGKCYALENADWDELINHDRLHQHLRSLVNKLSPAGDESLPEKLPLQAPLKSQEVWAAGVTYLKSKTARMEESEASGGAVFYDKVYEAERPELFFKANAHRVVGHRDLVRIRRDSTWDVPEPELTLFINRLGHIAGYSIGNDMSSRSIEGENPLYLPQAKCYDRSAALGPCLYVPEQPIPQDTRIIMRILRDKKVVFEGKTSISQMKRKHTELVDFLFRECSFPQGVFLMTGTCIVPERDVTLRAADEIQISIDHIGSLINFVA
jgi:2-dehydro-3-deoxy-D-arabinonate dehydratase